MVNRNPAIVSGHAYDPCSTPLIRESAGRGDMDNDTEMDESDLTRIENASVGTTWDPRGDMDETDLGLFETKQGNRPPTASPTVTQALSNAWTTRSCSRAARTSPSAPRPRPPKAS